VISTRTGTSPLLPDTLLEVFRMGIAFYDDRRCANERLNAGAIASCAWRGMS
jgi:hypothetical protein